MYNRSFTSFIQSGLGKVAKKCNIKRANNVFSLNFKM